MSARTAKVMPRVTDPTMRPNHSEHQSKLTQKSAKDVPANKLANIKNNATKVEDHGGMEEDEDFEQHLKEDILDEPEDCDSGSNFFKKNKKIIVVVGLLLIILIVVIIWWVMHKNKNNEEEMLRQQQLRRIQQRNDMMAQQYNSMTHAPNAANQNNNLQTARVVNPGKPQTESKDTNPAGLPSNDISMPPSFMQIPAESSNVKAPKGVKSKDEERENINQLLSQTSNLLENNEKKVEEDHEEETEEDRKLVEKFTQQLVDDKEDL